MGLFSAEGAPSKWPFQNLIISGGEGESDDELAYFPDPWEWDERRKKKDRYFKKNKKKKTPLCDYYWENKENSPTTTYARPILMDLNLT